LVLGRSEAIARLELQNRVHRQRAEALVEKPTGLKLGLRRFHVGTMGRRL